jgi:hypothetical protein
MGLTLACGGQGPEVEAPEDPVVEAPAEPEEEAVPEEPKVVSALPLATGHRWTYEIRERKGAGARILFIPTKKAENKKIADWAFEIGEAREQGFTAKLVRTPVGDELPSTTEMRLWEEDGGLWMDAGKGARPAIEAHMPPDPVSSERVRCVAHVLGGVLGTCAPMGGGPLAVDPGLHHGVVAENLKEGAELGQFLVGLVSVGLFIPGNQSSVQTATLTGFTPGAGTEAAFRARPGGPVEQAAAEVARAPDLEVLSTAEKAAGKLPEDRRYPVVRVAVPRAREGGLTALARLRGQLPAETPEAHVDAIAALFEDEADRATATLVLGDQPLLTEVLARTEGPFDDDRMDALEDALAVYPVTPDGAVAVVRQFQFDAGRRQAIERLVPGLPEAERAEVLARMFETLAFDEARLALLRDHAALLGTLPASRRRELARATVFHEEEARGILGL